MMTRGATLADVFKPAAMLVLAGLLGLTAACGAGGQRNLTDTEQELLADEGYVEVDGSVSIPVNTETQVTDDLWLAVTAASKNGGEIAVAYSGDAPVDEDRRFDVESVSLVGPYRIHVIDGDDTGITFAIAREQ